jgi:hypothetical protein
MRIPLSPRWLVLVVPALLLAGCDRDEIRTELVPKQSPLPFTFEVPPGWKELGGRVEQKGIIRVDILAAFSLVGGAKDDEMNITALKGGGGAEALVKRWADQVERKAGEELPKAEPITVGGSKGNYYDIPGPRKRILVAVVPGDELTWFYKLIADKDVAGKNEAAFKKFLGSVKQKGADNE